MASLTEIKAQQPGNSGWCTFFNALKRTIFFLSKYHVIDRRQLAEFQLSLSINTYFTSYLCQYGTLVFLEEANYTVDFLFKKSDYKEVSMLCMIQSHHLWQGSIYWAHTHTFVYTKRMLEGISGLPLLYFSFSHPVSFPPWCKLFLFIKEVSCQRMRAGWRLGTCGQSFPSLYVTRL